MDNNTPPVMDVKELSEFLKIKKSTLYKNLSVAQAKGEVYLPFIKLNGRLLFRTEAILNHLASLEVEK